MDIDINLIKSVLGGVASAIGVLVAKHKLYTSSVSQHVKLRRLKSQAWDRMLEKERWRTAAPIALQDAFTGRFGYELDDGQIRFSLGRTNALDLLRNLRTAKGMIRLKSDGTGFERWKGLKKEARSYRWHSVVAFAIGYVPFVVLTLVGGYLSKAIGNKEVMIWITIVVFAWTLALVFAAIFYESAHRVVETLDERCPAWVPDDRSPPAQQSATDKPTGDNGPPVRKRGARTRSAKAAEGASV